MNIKIVLPKKAPKSLLNRAESALKKVEAGVARLRKSEAFGYRTMELGRCERLVLVSDQLGYVFNNHKDYERFINRSMLYILPHLDSR